MKHKLQRVGQSAKQSTVSGLRWGWRHKFRIGVLALVLIVVTPRPVKTQIIDPCCAILAAGLTTIADTLTNVIGGGLNAILSTERALQTFEETVVWPRQLIAEAQGLVGSLQGIYRQIRGVTSIPVNSATLAAPQQLESNVLSRDASQIGNTGANYVAVYGSVPNQRAASEQVRNLIDITDAVAQAALKRSIAIDHLAELQLQAADQINQSIRTAAPGSAPIIEAQASAWLVRSNAYTQAAMADLMRVRAIDLANAGADVKMGATNASSLQRKIQQMLQPR